MRVKNANKRGLINRPVRSQSLDKKRWDELEVGKDYRTTLHGDTKDASWYVRVTDDSKTKRYGHVKLGASDGGSGSASEISNRSHYEYDDDVPAEISKKFDSMERELVIREGDILCGSWGYNMTTPEFYKVLRRQGKSVTVQRLRKLEKHDVYGNYTAMPNLEDPADPPENRRVLKDGLMEYVKSQYCSLRKWDGNPRSGNDYD